jgi:hypothetical protein
MKRGLELVNVGQRHIQAGRKCFRYAHYCVNASLRRASCVCASVRPTIRQSEIQHLLTKARDVPLLSIHCEPDADWRADLHQSGEYESDERVNHDDYASGT